MLVHRATLIAFLLLPARTALAQTPSLVVDLPRAGRPVLDLGGLLADTELRDAVRSGLPLRVRVRLELWRDRTFDELNAAETWYLLITYRALEDQFVVTTRGSPAVVRTVTSFDEARAAAEQIRTGSIRPVKEGRYYYTASVDVETLALSDLEELERWLKGELKPAVDGDQSIPGAIGAGAKRLLIRVLALPARTLELRSARFNYSR